jgi:flagellar protein FlaG
MPVSPMPLPQDFHRAVKHDDSASKPKTKEKPNIIMSTAEDLQRVFNRKLQFVVDYNSKQVIVKVIDKETDKVIKELPPEELQRLHKHIKETIGLSYDEMV